MYPGLSHDEIIEECIKELNHYFEVGPEVALISAEKGTCFKKCETDKKVQHGTPQSIQMQGSFWPSAIRVTLWRIRYF